MLAPVQLVSMLLAGETTVHLRGPLSAPVQGGRLCSQQQMSQAVLRSGACAAIVLCASIRCQLCFLPLHALVLSGHEAAAGSKRVLLQATLSRPAAAAHAHQWLRVQTCTCSARMAD